jgi:class 3 adenylate cyclase
MFDGDRMVPVEAGQHLADGIRGARFIKLSGIDHAFYLVHGLGDEIERFVTGAVHRTEPNRVLASVLFTDIVGSTTRAAELGDRAWREVLERHDELVDRTVSEHGGRVVKHIGDGALAAFDGPAMAMRCAEALNDGVAELGIQLRSGIHTGECEAIGEDLGGLAVHIGARVGALAGPGEIVVSSTVKELVVGSDMQFADHGEHQLKGVPGSWHLYALGQERAPRVELDGAAAHMRRSDRVVVTLARRMPQAMRAAGQLAARGGPPR